MLNYAIFLPLILFAVSPPPPVDLFTPTQNVKLLTEYFDKLIDTQNLGSVSETLTHADILRIGLVRAVAKYFKAKQQHEGGVYSSRRTVDLAKMDTVYARDVTELYKDYLSETEYNMLSSCNLELDRAISFISDSVASVDFDENYKDLPSAHFDAETFQESNQFVRDNIKSIGVLIKSKNFVTARKLIGVTLHTIQDFYAHSNWIEMNRTDINKEIGGERLLNDPPIAAPDDATCFGQNCTKQKIECGANLDDLYKLSSALNLNLPIKCPVIFYKCKNNVLTDKLTSGYYIDQKRRDGTPVVKPPHKGKCSHGGYLDLTSNDDSVGGINKDTAFYFLSPHAHLHLQAAQMAIRHTEHFFDNLRQQIGDKNFDELLELLHGEQSKVICFFRKLFS